jgi:hypothetical protein
MKRHSWERDQHETWTVSKAYGLIPFSIAELALPNAFRIVGGAFRIVGQPRHYRVGAPTYREIEKLLPQ